MAAAMERGRGREQPQSDLRASYTTERFSRTGSLFNGRPPKHPEGDFPASSSHEHYHGFPTLETPRSDSSFELQANSEFLPAGTFRGGGGVLSSSNGGAREGGGGPDRSSGQPRFGGTPKAPPKPDERPIDDDEDAVQRQIQLSERLLGRRIAASKAPPDTDTSARSPVFSSRKGSSRVAWDDGAEEETARGEGGGGGTYTRKASNQYISDSEAPVRNSSLGGTLERNGRQALAAKNQKGLDDMQEYYEHRIQELAQQQEQQQRGGGGANFYQGDVLPRPPPLLSQRTQLASSALPGGGAGVAHAMTWQQPPPPPPPAQLPTGPPGPSNPDAAWHHQLRYDSAAPMSASLDPGRVSDAVHAGTPTVTSREKQMASEMVTLHESARTLERAIAEWEAKSKELTACNRDLEDRVATVVASEALSQQKAREEQERATRLEEDIREAMQRLREKDSELSACEQRNRELSEKLSGTAEKLSLSEAHAQSLVSEVDQLRRRLIEQSESAEQERRALVTEVDSFRANSASAVDALRSEAASARATLQRAESDAARLREELADVRSRMQDLEKTNWNLTVGAERTQREMDNLKFQVATRETELAQTHAMLQSAKEENAQLYRTLRRQEATALSFQANSTAAGPRNHDPAGDSWNPSPSSARRPEPAFDYFSGASGVQASSPSPRWQSEGSQQSSFSRQSSSARPPHATAPYATHPPPPSTAAQQDPGFRKPGDFYNSPRKASEPSSPHHRDSISSRAQPPPQQQQQQAQKQEQQHQARSFPYSPSRSFHDPRPEQGSASATPRAWASAPFGLAPLNTGPGVGVHPSPPPAPPPVYQQREEGGTPGGRGERGGEGGGPSPYARSGSTTLEGTPFATDASLRESMSRTAELEQKLMSLGMEKQQVESDLSKMPATAGKTMSERKKKAGLEARHEELSKEIGRLRLHLRELHVLH